jgi:hypothetical protein
MGDLAVAIQRAEFAGERLPDFKYGLNAMVGNLQLGIDV